jgi:hypothetical protein
VKLGKCGDHKRGSALLEQVLAIGLLGGLLVVVAVMTVKTKQAGQLSQLTAEANCLAQDLIERQLTVKLADLPVSPATSGKLHNGVDYQGVVETYSLGAAGLTDDEIKGVRATISWVDSLGPHKVQAETVVAKVPK